MIKVLYRVLFCFLLVSFAAKAIFAAPDGSDSDVYYPVVVGSQWIYQEQHNGKTKPVTVILDKPVTVNHTEAILFTGKSDGLSYVVQRKEDGVYLLQSSRPFLGLISMGVDFTPPLKILQFPLRQGDRWDYHGRVGNWLDSKKVDVEYTNGGVEYRQYDGKQVKAFRIVGVFKIGDKPPAVQTTWYGEGLGYMGSQTSDTQSVLTDCHIPDLGESAKSTVAAVVPKP